MPSTRWFSRVHGRSLLAVAAILAADTAGADEGITLPKGTAIDIVMADSLSSRFASVGDGFDARLARALYLDGRPVLLAGTPVEGEVDAVESLRNGAESGYVGVRFVSIVLPSERTSTKIAATLSGMPQADAADPQLLEQEIRLAVVLIAASPASGREEAIVLDKSAAGDYSQTRLSESDVEVSAGTQLSMQLDEPLTAPAHAVRAALRTEVVRARQASSTDTAAIQRALKARALYSGPIDGYLGDETRLGILKFQIDSKYPATGDVDARMLAALGLRPTAAGK
jgi:hypothetical protein